MAAIDQIRLLHLKNTQFVLCCYKKDMMGSKNQRQSSTDAFEYRCSWKFRKFHRKISVLERLFNKVAGLELY